MSIIPKRLYVLVRKDLNPVYALVQGGHAVAQHCMEHPNAWKNEYLLYLSVDSIEELEKWEKKLIRERKPYSFFIEPDIGDQLTAIAAEDNGEFFQELPLFNISSK